MQNPIFLLTRLENDCDIDWLTPIFTSLHRAYVPLLTLQAKPIYDVIERFASVINLVAAIGMRHEMRFFFRKRGRRRPDGVLSSFPTIRRCLSKSTYAWVVYHDNIGLCFLWLILPPRETGRHKGKNRFAKDTCDWYPVSGVHPGHRGSKGRPVIALDKYRGSIFTPCLYF